MIRRLLIVDDHAGFRDAVRTLLHGAGFDVVAAVATGAEALAVLAERRTDAVLLDVQLPDTNGFELCRAVRRAYPHVGVLLCSIRPAADYGREVTLCGADGFLEKGQLSASAVLAFLR